ncbi:MAG: DUF2294 family protein [Syntrophomonadaceae bacterium]|nr:DUF2294 family protein [Syntrophomonadaceae bacterium]
MEATLGALKKNIMRIYNAVNQEMFETGVKRLRVDVIGTRIIILADHQRLAGLAALDSTNRFVTRLADVALLDENKRRLKATIEAQYPNIKIKTVLKDYDPFTEIAGTIIVTEQPLDEIFS